MKHYNGARCQSGFPTFISCQRQDANVLPKRQQSHQGDKLCDVSTVPLVARWPVFLTHGSDADGEPHGAWYNSPWSHNASSPVTSTGPQVNKLLALQASRHSSRGIFEDKKVDS